MASGEYKEEICEIRKGMQKGVKMFVEELYGYAEKKRDISMHEMMCLSDMMKDMSEVEKNLAKADYYDRKTS